jgi:hypothetical protein
MQVQTAYRRALVIFTVPEAVQVPDFTEGP